jgi:hypothetical protein
MRIDDEFWSIDIETVSQGQRADEYTEEPDVKTGNLVDPEKIKAKIELAKHKAKSTHGLYWWTGKIVCIGMVNVRSGERHAFYGASEDKLLREWAESLSTYTRLVGANSKDFDYPFIIGRLIANNIPLPRVMKNYLDRYDVFVELFGFSSSASQRGKLKDYAHGLGIEGKTMHGSQVQGVYDSILFEKDEAVRSEMWSTLVEYCLHDCEIVAELVRRYDKTKEQTGEAIADTNGTATGSMPFDFNKGQF